MESKFSRNSSALWNISIAKALEFPSGLISFDSLEIMLSGKFKSTSLTWTVDRPSSGGGGVSGSKPYHSCSCPLMLASLLTSATAVSLPLTVYHSIGPDLFRTPISFSSYGVLIPGLNKAVNCSINSGQVDIMKNKQM